MRIVGARALILALVATLAACASPTPYRPAEGGQGYGYGETRIERDRWRVAFSGNRLTSRGAVENALLLRAAELTRAEGGDHFVIVLRSVDPATEEVVTASGFGARPFVYGRSSARIDRSTRYTASAEIVLGRGPKPEGAPNAYDARDVLRTLGPQVRAAPARP